MGASEIIGLLGGIALFLFGMAIMGDGLKKVAGSKLELVLYKLTSTPLKGVLLGTGVTAVIQSSSATSVMVVGFVNSGMMKVNQAIGIVMGAILGTSVTGWILCLSSLSGGSGWVTLLSTATLTGLVAVVGIILRMAAKRPSTHPHRGHPAGLRGADVRHERHERRRLPPAGQPGVHRRPDLLLRTPCWAFWWACCSPASSRAASAACGVFVQALAVTGAITFEIALPIIMGHRHRRGGAVLLSALGYALYITTVNKFLAGGSTSRLKIGGRKLTFYVFVVSTALFAIKAGTNQGIQPIPDSMSFVNLILLAIVPTVISNITLVLAVHNIGGTLTAVLGAVEPITAVCVGILVFSEPFTPNLAVGILLIIIAVTMIILSKSIQGTLRKIYRKAAHFQVSK